MRTIRIRNVAQHARRSQAWPRIVWDDRGWDGNDWLNARVRSAGRAGPVKVGPKAGGELPALGSNRKCVNNSSLWASTTGSSSTRYEKKGVD